LRTHHPPTTSRTAQHSRRVTHTHTGRARFLWIGASLRSGGRGRQRVEHQHCRPRQLMAGRGRHPPPPERDEGPTGYGQGIAGRKAGSHGRHGTFVNGRGGEVAIPTFPIGRLRAHRCAGPAPIGSAGGVAHRNRDHHGMWPIRMGSLGVSGLPRVTGQVGGEGARWHRERLQELSRGRGSGSIRRRGVGSWPGREFDCGGNSVR
jgi:hypothetical protein